MTTPDVTVGIIKPEALKKTRAVRAFVQHHGLKVAGWNTVLWNMELMEVVYRDAPWIEAGVAACEEATFLHKPCEPIVVTGPHAVRRLHEMQGPELAREYKRPEHSDTIHGVFGLPEKYDVTKDMGEKARTFSFNGFYAPGDWQEALRVAEACFGERVRKRHGLVYAGAHHPPVSGLQR